MTAHSTLTRQLADHHREERTRVPRAQRFVAGCRRGSWRGVHAAAGTRGHVRQGGHELPVINGNGQWTLPLPATYVIDRDGRDQPGSQRGRDLRRGTLS